MKLLLTSGGIKHEQVVEALLELAGAPAAELNLVFVPTAASIEDEDKSWLIDDLLSFRQLGFRRIDIVDIAALTSEQVMPRLAQADILVFGGGNTQYLLQCMHAKDLAGSLRDLLQSRVLVGISAGSVMCCPVINPRQSPGLGYVDFLFVPHRGSHFARRTRDDVQRFVDMVQTRAYWLDDSSALQINGSQFSMIGAGVELVEPSTPH